MVNFIFEKKERVKVFYFQKIVVFYFLFLMCLKVNAQKKIEEVPDSSKQVVQSIIVDGDTIPVYHYGPVMIYSPRVFKNKREERKYGRLKRYVAKVYPYAKIAGEMLQDFDDTLKTIKSELKRKRYIKKVEKQLMAEFEGELKKLTIKQGIILIKLIDRETGNTSYSLVKELRGSFSAFIWQSLARLFGSNLKLQYDPDGEDALIEEIVVLIENGQIPYVKRERKL